MLWANVANPAGRFVQEVLLFGVVVSLPETAPRSRGRNPHFLNEAPSRTHRRANARRAVKETGSPASTAPSHVRAEGRGDRRVHRHRTTVPSRPLRRSPRTTIRTLDGPNARESPFPSLRAMLWANAANPAGRFVQEVLLFGVVVSLRETAPRSRGRNSHFLNEAPSRTRRRVNAWRAVKETGSPASTAPSHVRAEVRGDRRVRRHRTAVPSIPLRRAPRTTFRPWEGPNPRESPFPSLRAGHRANVADWARRSVQEGLLCAL
jgi:hypothetical protein